MKRLVVLFLMVLFSFCFPEEKSSLVENFPVLYLDNELAEYEGSLVIYRITDTEEPSWDNPENYLNFKYFIKGNPIVNTMYRENFLFHEVQDLIYSFDLYEKQSKGIKDYFKKSRNTWNRYWGNGFRYFTLVGGSTSGMQYATITYVDRGGDINIKYGFQLFKDRDLVFTMLFSEEDYELFEKVVRKEYKLLSNF